MFQDENFIGDPVRQALREAYRAILSWPIKKKTTGNDNLGGTTLPVAADPLANETNHDPSIPENKI
jgi:hypothetical protein